MGIVTEDWLLGSTKAFFSFLGVSLPFFHPLWNSYGSPDAYPRKPRFPASAFEKVEERREIS